jgi:hypothetical protein
MILTNFACQFCHNRPKFVDGAKTHDFCSKACARTAYPQRKGSSIGKSSQPSASSQPTNSQSHNTPPAVCQAPGCTNPPHPGHDYCSIAHKKFITMPSCSHTALIPFLQFGRESLSYVPSSTQDGPLPFLQPNLCRRRRE